MRSHVVALSLVLALGASSCTLGVNEDDLNARCEVHLDELTWPVVDLEALTGRSSPSDRCELFLSSLSQEGEVVFERAEPERWGVLCDGAEPPPRNCRVELDPVLAANHEDGLLLCRPEPGRACAGRRPRTVRAKRRDRRCT